MATLSINAKSVKMGDIAADGGAATVLTTFGDIKESTFKITEAEGNKTPIRVLGKSKPRTNIVQDGDTTVAFDLIDFDPEVMADLMGGTVTGAAPNQIWNAPVIKPKVVKTIQVVDAEDYVWTLAAVELSATLQGVFSPTDVNTIRVTGTVLQPTKEGVAPITYGKPA